jgi:putative Mg2+ transporter-C (MgtC) family protein
MEWSDVLLRLGLAVLFGLLVGMEREHHHRPAGVKTHILVCVGAALVSLMQVQMTAETVQIVGADPGLSNVLKSDVGRLGAQVISGIGFLGAGTILRDKGTIKGLTTAATLWLTACVGLAAGMGYYLISVTTIALTMTVLIILHIVQNILLKVRGVKHIEVSLFDKYEAVKFINDYCVSHNITIQSFEMGSQYMSSDSDGLSRPLLSCTYEVLIPRTTTINRVLTDWQMDQYIASAVISDTSIE